VADVVPVLELVDDPAAVGDAHRFSWSPSFSIMSAPPGVPAVVVVVPAAVLPLLSLVLLAVESIDAARKAIA
jgi:hypothetical protein